MREGSDRISARIDSGLPVEPVAMRDGNARLEAREAPAMAARTRPGRSIGDGVGRSRLGRAPPVCWSRAVLVLKLRSEGSIDRLPRGLST